MNLDRRIQKLEVLASPIKAEQESIRENQQLRIEILRERKTMVEEMLPQYKYVHGDELDEDETTKDIIEIDLLYHSEATKQFGTDERGYYKATPDQLKEITLQVVRLFDRHFFRNHQTVEQQQKEQEQWKQAKEDMAASVPTAESEAAEYIRQLYKRYPRNPNAERFYNIWD